MNAANRCDRIAARQLGLITRRQALAAGLSPRQIAGRLSTGAWRAELPRVYSLSSAAPTWKRRAVAAFMWAGEGGALSYASAFRVWGFDNSQPGPIEISTTRCLRSTTVIVHRVGAWLQDEVAIHDGIRVTSVARTVADLAGRLDEVRLESLIDEALRRRLTTEPDLAAYVTRLNGLNRPGAGRLRCVMGARGHQVQPAESPLETRLARLIRASRLPQPVRQHVVRDERGRFVARVDFAWPEHRVVVEAQSFLHHAVKSSFQRDLARMNALVDCGLTVLQVTWDDVEVRPTATMELLGRTLQQRATG